MTFLNEVRHWGAGFESLKLMPLPDYSRCFMFVIKDVISYLLPAAMLVPLWWTLIPLGPKTK